MMEEMATQTEKRDDETRVFQQNEDSGDKRFMQDTMALLDDLSTDFELSKRHANRYQSSVDTKLFKDRKAFDDAGEKALANAMKQASKATNLLSKESGRTSAELSANVYRLAKQVA